MKLRQIVCVNLALICIVLPFRSQSSANNETITAIVGATLIDGLHPTPLKDSVVLFRAGRIVRVGTPSTIEVPADAKVIDGHGKWLIPGLIDMHVHLDEVVTPIMFAQYGVTSVRDVGSRLVTIQHWRSLRAASTPHIYWMGRNIDEHKPSWWGAVAVNGPSEVPALLADMERQGVDGVKLYVNSEPEVTKAVIQEAHLRGWPVTAHCGKTTPLQAAQLGIDNLEHASQMFVGIKSQNHAPVLGYFAGFEGVPETDLNGKKMQALVKTLAERGVAVTPTLSASLMPVVGEKGAQNYYLPWCNIGSDWQKEWRRGYWDFISTKGWTQKQHDTALAANRTYSKLVGKLYRAGVPLIAGTDCPAPWVLPGAGLLVELELMSQAGVPNGELIKAATSRAADILHRSDDVGAIAPGRSADMVILNADPLISIKNLHKISRVFLRGTSVSMSTTTK